MNPLELLQNYTYTQALLGTVLIGGCAGALGPLVYVRRTSLLADAISHSSLPGLLTAFLVATAIGWDGRNVWLLSCGALLTGTLAVGCIHLIPRLTPLGQTTAMAATLTTFFSVGMLLMQYISRRPLPGKAGIQDYLLGNASTLTRADVRSTLIIGGCVLLFLFLIHTRQAAVTFDSSFAQVAGIRTSFLNAASFFALTAITVLGVKVVGVVLMVAVVISPAAAARPWTTRLLPFIALSGFLGAATAALGCYVSIAHGPLPTGPVIVLAQAALVTISLLSRKLAS